LDLFGQKDLLLLPTATTNCHYSIKFILIINEWDEAGVVLDEAEAVEAEFG
jgi:hypothetical protein